jgi:cytochrome subunit of sulfide dehydrogenase
MKIAIVALGRSLLVTAAFAWFAPIQAADVPGDAKLCAKCHGEKGLSTKDNIPTIAGIPVDIQVYSLEEYRAGKRTCEEQPLMCKTAARLTDEQIKALAEHYAAQSFAPAQQTFDAARAEKGKAIDARDCDGCHKNPGDEADGPVLRGQWRGYLAHTIKQYLAGGREWPDPLMKSKLEKLAPADVEALLDYYASFK